MSFNHSSGEELCRSPYPPFFFDFNVKKCRLHSCHVERNETSHEIFHFVKNDKKWKKTGGRGSPFFGGRKTLCRPPVCFHFRAGTDVLKFFGGRNDDACQSGNIFLQFYNTEREKSFCRTSICDLFFPVVRLRRTLARSKLSQKRDYSAASSDERFKETCFRATICGRVRMSFKNSSGEDILAGSVPSAYKHMQSTNTVRAYNIK